MKEYSFAEACEAFEDVYALAKSQRHEAKRLYEIKFRGAGFGFSLMFLLDYWMFLAIAIKDDWENIATFLVAVAGIIFWAIAFKAFNSRYEKKQYQLKLELKKGEELLEGLKKWQKKFEALERGGPFIIEYFLVKGLDFFLSESTQSREPLPEEIGRLQVKLADEFNGIVKQVGYHT